MKVTHRDDLFAWSVFDQARNIDFHSLLWGRRDGNVAIDPLPLSAHDREHLERLGGVATIVITNSDHTRDAKALAKSTGATICAPAAERDSFPISVDRWLEDGEDVVPGLRVLALDGSKTPGELALVLDRKTLITGDLVRSHAGGTLHMLPDAKLANRSGAVASVKRLATLPDIDAVLVGDGWPIFRGGNVALADLAASLDAANSD